MEIQEYRSLVGALESELALKTKRITKLEAFVGDVLRLSRYPWLHPERAENAERLMVQELLERAWKLLPGDNKASLTATQYLYETITYAQNDESPGPEGLPPEVLQRLSPGVQRVLDRSAEPPDPGADAGA